MIFFLKRTTNKIFNKLDYILGSFPFIYQNSRFRYGGYGGNEFEFEVDKQLLEAYVEFYSQSNDINKRNYAQIIKAISDKTTSQVVKIQPRRNPWDTENKFIKEESLGKITYWQSYEAIIDVILSSKILGFDVNSFKYYQDFSKDKYLTFHEKKDYYAPTIVAIPENILELNDIKILVKILRKEFDESLEITDITKGKDSRVKNYLKIMIKGSKKSLESIIKAEYEAGLNILLIDNGLFRLRIDSAGFIKSGIYLRIDGYTFESVDECKRIIISQDIHEAGKELSN